MVLLGMWGCPKYRVYQQGMEGQAELQRAQQNRQIAVNEAEAKRDSAKMLAEAEVERAKGVAQANEIIGESLKENEAYLRYLWIQGLQDGPKATCRFLKLESGNSITLAITGPMAQRRKSAK